MEPTIPQDSTVIVDFSAYRDQKVRRNDLVCFIPHEYPDLVFIFRVVGLPNEQIRLKDSAIHADGQPTDIKGIEEFGFLEDPVALGSDEYFVLGDNTKMSRDSRFFGPIKKSQILGKVTKVQPPAGGNSRP